MEKEYSDPMIEVLVGAQEYCDKNGIIMYSPLMYMPGGRNENPKLWFFVDTMVSDERLRPWKKDSFYNKYTPERQGLRRDLFMSLEEKEEIGNYLEEFGINHLNLPDFTPLSAGLPAFKSEISGILKQINAGNEPLSEVIEEKFPFGFKTKKLDNLFSYNTREMHLAVPFTREWKLNDNSHLSQNKLSYHGQIHFNEGRVYLSLEGISLPTDKIVLPTSTFSEFPWFGDIVMSESEFFKLEGSDLYELKNLTFENGKSISGNVVYNSNSGNYFPKNHGFNYDIENIKSLENIAAWIAIRRPRDIFEGRRR